MNIDRLNFDWVLHKIQKLIQRRLIQRIIRYVYTYIYIVFDLNHSDVSFSMRAMHAFTFQKWIHIDTIYTYIVFVPHVSYVHYTWIHMNTYICTYIYIYTHTLSSGTTHTCSNWSSISFISRSSSSSGCSSGREAATTWFTPSFMVPQLQTLEVVSAGDAAMTKAQHRIWRRFSWHLHP